MKLPKLKYYYHAMSPAEYQAFERSRQVLVDRQVTIDVQSGQMSGRTHVILTGAAVSCDQEYRDRTKTWAAVMVLRIPAELIDRALLTPVPGQILVYQYSCGLDIAHCGVERIEIDTEKPQPEIHNILI